MASSSTSSSVSDRSPPQKLPLLQAPSPGLTAGVRPLKISRPASQNATTTTNAHVPFVSWRSMTKRKGAGSDRVAGRHWLQKQRRALTAPPGQTINFTPVFNSDVVNSSFAVNAGAAGPADAPESPSASAHADGPDDTEDDIGEQERGEADGGLLPSTVGGPVLADERVIESLTATYQRQSHRWRLASGRDVETVLFENCRRMSFPVSASSLALSFTIDLDDPNMRSWFEPEELDEISKSLPEPPSTPGILSMVQSLHRFRSCKSPADLRNVLATTSFLEPGQTFDAERDFLRMWADLVIRNLLVLWESPAHPLRSQQLEDFYSNLIWAPILDQCFLSFPSIVLVRKDSPCRSTAARKNRARTLDTRMRQGRRLDGVIRSTGDEAHEFGGMEVARSAAGGLKSTKRLGDEEKLLKALRDMLAVLCGLVNVLGEDKPSLQVVGVLCAGLKMQVIKMGCYREGGVAVVLRQQVVEIPEELNGLTGLTKVLVMVASMKAVVEQTSKAISQRHNSTSSADKSDEDLIKEILQGTVTETNLGWAADTPSPEP
ncbi:uncharacterized protein LAJ45_03729 [Morchella importuna]|uniref:uncharacterized protein n=1 Tax=Morchella importuna TaxID=1174673 RepID=UPI001E8E8815|nr:uncharacterized protein LAJ45_03729 [Morchella importuna]KAH8152302.1 hypothetical protein LAJ45_03729 [Morchella importuna]